MPVEPLVNPASGRRALLIYLVVGVVAVGILALALAKWPDSPRPKSPVVIVGGSPTLLVPHPKEQAPAREAQRVHQELHAIGRACQSGKGDRTNRVRPHVKAILDFARRYPDVSFPIDDETGTTMSLLIVTRYSLRTCAPALGSRVNQALPTQYQTSGPSD